MMLSTMKSPVRNYLINEWENIEKEVTESGALILKPDVIRKDEFLSSLANQKLDILTDKDSINYITMQAVVPTGKGFRPIKSFEDSLIAVVNSEVFLESGYHMQYLFEEVPYDYSDRLINFALSKERELQGPEFNKFVSDINSVIDDTDIEFESLQAEWMECMQIAYEDEKHEEER